MALDAADAWKAALEVAGVPSAEMFDGSPLLMDVLVDSFMSAAAEAVVGAVLDTVIDAVIH